MFAQVRDKWEQVEPDRSWLPRLACVMAGYPPARGGDEKKFRGELRTRSARSRPFSQSIAQGNDRDETRSENERRLRALLRERAWRKIVLQTPDKVYKLDTQALAEQWAGLKVRIVGSLTPRQTHYVRSIEPVSPSASKTLPPRDGQRFESSIRGCQNPPQEFVVAGDRNHNKSRHKSCGHSSLDFRNYFLKRTRVSS